MSMTAETFQKWSNKLPEKVTYRNGKENQLWEVPAHFCAMRYINDGGFLPGSGTSEGTLLQKE